MFYAGFNFLKGIDFLNSTKRFYVLYPNVAGLQVSNSVIVNGLSVGRVSEIKIEDDSAHTLKVAFDIDKNIEVGENATAMIASPDLLSGKALILTLGDINKPLKNKSFIKGEIEQGFMSKISETASPIVGNLQTSITRLNQLIAEENIKNISLMIANLKKTTEMINLMIATNQQNLLATTENIKKLTASLVETEKQLKPILSKMDVFADSLNKMQLASTIATTNQTIAELQTTLETINKGQGTLGKLVKDDSLYINLNNTARDLDLLLIDLKKKPSRYVQFSVFGKKEKQ